MSEEIYSRLQSVFAEVFDDDSIVVGPELTADQVDEWDSLSHIRLVISVEQEFGIKFPTTGVMDLKNVGELADLLENEISK